MHPTRNRDNSHDTNAPKNARNTSGGQISSRKPAKRTAARLAEIKLSGILNARALLTFVAIALVTTILTATAYMRTQSASTERDSLKPSPNETAVNMSPIAKPLEILAVTYFSKAAATDFTDVNSWGTAADGSGASPASISNADDFVIQNGSSMNLNAGSAAVRSLTINAGSLAISSNTLTVAIASQNNSTLAVNSGGTLNVSGGILNLNGNFVLATGGTFNQSGGDIAVDGNNGGVTATSVASGTSIVAFNTTTLVAVTMTGGTFTIVDPHAATTATNVLTLSGSATGQIAATTAHTLRFGDGVSTDAGGNAVGFQMDPWASTTGLKFGNVVFNGPTGTNRIFTLTSGTFAALVVGGNLTVNSGADFRHTSTTATTGAIYCNGNLTVNSGGTYTDLGTLRLSDGNYTSGTTIGIVASTNAQVVSGTGTFRNLTASPTANYTSLVINNSNATGVSFSSANSLISGAVTGTVSGTFTWTAGLVSTGANTFILGTGTAALGTLTYTAGGFTTGSTFGRWYATATAGTTITASTVPTVGTGSYPFLVGTNSRNFHINRPTTTGATGGVIRVSHTDGAGVNTITPVVDGAYSIDRQTNANWTVSTSNGFAAGTGTFSYAVSGQGTYVVVNGNSRVMKVATVVGAHQTGTTLPHGQRTGIAAADYTGTFYLGVNSADIPVASVQSGAWDDPATWGGTAPVCGNNVVIQSGHTVTVNAAAANAGPVTVNSGGTLVVSGNTLTVGCTNNNSALTSNGTLTVSGGTVAVNGNLAINNGSTFTHSAGNITIDGNNNSGTTGNASSVASGTPLFSIGFGTQFSTGIVTLSGGTITIVDPHIGSATATSAYSVYANLASGVNVNASTSHTFQFGDGVSTAAGSSTSGFVFDGFVGSGRLNFGNVTVNSAAGTNRIVTQTTNTNAINGNLTVTLGTISNNALTTNIGGNISVATGGNFITGNGTTLGTVVFALTTGTATAAQTVAQSVSVSGAGTINSASASPTANFFNVTLNNTSATGVTFGALNNNSGAAGFSGASVLNSLTFTAGRATTSGTNALLWGTSTARGLGTLTQTSGGMSSGSTFAIGTTAAQSGTTISTGAVPSSTLGLYPFVDPSGNSRNAWIQRVTPSGAGIIGVKYTDIVGTSTVSIVDGAYTVNIQYNSTWAVSTFGTTPSAATFNLAISATNAFGATPTAANMRITTLAGVLGTHQAGTTLPHAQRTGLTLANLTGQAFYVGINSADVPFASAATGDWGIGATWNRGTVPTSADNVTIAAGHTVTVSSGSQAALTVTVNSTGALTVSGGSLAVTGASGTGVSNAGTLTVGGGTVNVGITNNTLCNRTFTNNGTLTVSSGTLNIFGNLNSPSGSTLNQSGGDINVDGNAGGVSANSVANGTALVFLGPTALSNVSLTGGTFTIVDPHANATLNSAFSLNTTATGTVSASAAHTFRFGNGTSTDAGGNVGGFNYNPWVTTGGMRWGNIVIEGPAGTNRSVALPTTFSTLFGVGDLTINNGGSLVQTGTALSATIAMGGNVTVNTGGSLTTQGLFLLGNGSYVDSTTIGASATTTAQMITKTGTIQNLTASPTANFTNLQLVNSNATGVSLVGGDISLSGALTFTQGNVTTNANTLTINSTGTVSRTSGHVIGNLQKIFTATGSKTFEVGTANGYSPVNTNVTALGTNPSSLRVSAVQGPQPDISATTSLKRYWQLAETGDLTTTLTFNYLDPTDIMGTEANYRIIRVSGGTAVSFPNACPSSPCVDTTGNTATIAGVSEFSDWTLGEPLAPTAVKLRSFTAKRTDDGVLLEWQSGFETDNLGYNIYREQNGERVLVSPSLIAGSALKTGQGTALTAGMSYVWWDTNASERAQYWLEDVDLNGESTLYGPFIQQRATADTARPAASRLLSQLTTGKSGLLPAAAQTEWPAAFDSQARGKASVAPVINGLQASPADQQFELAGRAAVKMSINQDGWYRVSQAQLVAAGLSANADRARLQLYVNGEERPMVVGADGTIQFYGRKLDTLTTDTAVYWLVEGTTSGQRIQTLPVIEAGDQIATSFAMTVERKDRVTYFSSLQNGDASNIFGPVISSDTVTQALNLRNLAANANAQAQLEVAVQGVTTQGHLLRVTLNGEEVGVISFTGREHNVFSVPVAMSLLHEGENTVALSRLNGPGDTNLLDYVRLTYARHYEAENDRLACAIPAGRTVRLGGFNSEAVHVMDITNPDQPRELKITGVEPEYHGYAVTLALPQDARLLAFTDESAGLNPVATVANEPTHWHEQQRGAEMVIITHRDFRQAVEPLAALRRQQGLRVAVIDVEDLYDEFSYGAHTPQAVKDFLAQTRQNWQTPPQYVLLVGDSSWDARNELGLTQSEFVPTKLIDTDFMETSSDDWLADFDGDGVANMAVGRLPVKTASQAATLVSKIIAYDSAPVDPQRGAMMVADSGFEASSDSVRALLPQGMPVQTINRSSATDSVIRQQILTGINAGPRIVNYIGHGSIQVWTGAGLLQNSDAGSLTNGNRLPLFVVMTCLNGYAHDAYIDSLSEALLKAENGGAIAVWSSSGYTEPGGQVPINKQLYQEMFNQPGIRLGDAIKLAKGATVSSDVRRTWVLLGDPSMRLR